MKKPWLQSCVGNNGWADKEGGLWLEVGRKDITFQWGLVSFLCYKMEEPGSKGEANGDGKG